MKSDFATVGGLTLAYDQFGSDGDPAILLVMGNSAPGPVWPDRFCEMLAGDQFRVVRFDQRDTGLSSYLDFDLQPYTLFDLVDEAIGLLDRLGIDRAHVVGLSQGGVIAYMAALRHSSRVAGVAAIMSSPDLQSKNDAFTNRPEAEGRLPRPDRDYVRAVLALNGAPAKTDEEVAIRFKENFRLAAGPKSPFDESFWLDLGRTVATRRHDERAGMANHSNHSKAQIATPPLTEDNLSRVTQPCLIIHGDMDPIFPLPHAKWAERALPKAKLCIIPTMGHALDPAFFAPVASHLIKFVSADSGE